MTVCKMTQEVLPVRTEARPLGSLLITGLLVITSLLCFMPLHAQPHYIHEVLEYTPAPGQLINKGPWGLPESAESIVGTINGSLTLGAWGGYVVFRFENPVQNHPDNPYGVDFIIFGNASAAWSEPAAVWVMQDENENGLPDDTWFQLAGSDYFFSSTVRQYQLTYINPRSEAATDVPWEDHEGNTGFVFANSFHTQPYYPDHNRFSHIPDNHYTLSGTRIQGALNRSDPAMITSSRRAFGYADNTPRGTAPFDMPDNPYTAAIEHAGGDGFDISWAVDDEGNHVELDQIHFVKVQTAMLDHAGWMGEVSAEITGAVAVTARPGMTGILDMVVVKDLPPVINQTPYPLEALAFHQGRHQPHRAIRWSSDREDAYVDDEGWLHFTGSGSLQLNAYLDDNPEIAAVANTQLDYIPTHAGLHEPQGFRVFPNPAAEYLYVETEREARIILYDLRGIKLLEFVHHGGLQRHPTNNLKTGMYLLTIISEKGIHHEKIMIKKP